MQAITQQERSWAMLIHLSGLAGFIIPFGNIVAPLILWLMKKDQSIFINDQGKEALNFQITYTLYAIAAGLLIFLLIGLLLLPLVGIVALILIFVAGIRANEGTYYRYPLTLRLIS